MIDAPKYRMRLVRAHMDYIYILGEHDIVSIDECEVYTEFKVWDS